MFDRPVSGYVNMYIGEYEYFVEYLTDIPRDFLSSMVFALKEDKDFCVWVEFDYDTSLKIISDYYDTYLILGNELTIVRDFNKWQIAMEIYDDFREDFDEWCSWQCYKCRDEDEQKDYEVSFLHLLESLSAILQKPRIFLQNTERPGKRQKEFYEQLGGDMFKRKG